MMDPIKLEKFEAMNSYYNKNAKSSSNAFTVYILTALTCSLVFFSPFWYPSFESLINSIPALISHFLNPKCLFLVGNLIVFVLLGESKLLTSKPSRPQVYYDEYVGRRQRPVRADNVVVHNECKRVCEVTGSAVRSRSVVRKVELVEGNKEVRGGKGGVVRTLSAEELGKRADDFIARVNRQRKLEATDLVEWGV
uniref:DUF4408 domain-containing protein n=1 Tax=Kalanchoe fedtschenkoi TaxID=63787 RepID=A0A7N0U738_KALFE